MAGATFLGGGALVIVTSGDDVVGTADAAFDEAREQVLGPTLFSQYCAWLLTRLQLILYGVPEGLIENPQVRHSDLNPFGWITEPIATLPLFGFRIAAPLPPVPDEAANIEYP